MELNGKIKRLEKKKWKQIVQTSSDGIKPE